jgi:hypothetical protein
MTTMNTGAASMNFREFRAALCRFNDANTPVSIADRVMILSNAMFLLDEYERVNTTPQADAAPIIGQHDISTSTGGRAYIAEFFAKRLRRHDFQRYIEERLAADFACALAGYLSEHVAAIAAGGAQEPVAQWQSRPLKSNHEWINLDEADAKRIAERHSDIYEVRALYAAPLPRVAATVQDERTAFKLLAALLDILDDEQNNAPEHRCYVEGAWTDTIADARALLAASNGEQK